jgi:hypothetical protein
MIDSLESEVCENEAHREGFEWANNVTNVNDEEEEVIQILTA